MSGISTACLDWRERLVEGRSLIPSLLLDQDEAERAVRIFDRLRLPDVIGKPLLRDAGGDWYRNAVRALFGSYDVATSRRRIATVHMVVVKKQGKTTYSGGTMLTALMMNRRPNARFGILGGTQKIAEEAYDAAAGMIEADPKLQKFLKTTDHIKTIEHRLSGAYLNITSFDLKVATGGKFAGCLIDELHVLGRVPKADRVIGQITGARTAIHESFVWFITTQSEDPPAGVFETELKYARDVRDGIIEDPSYLPIIYEFPKEVQSDPNRPWEDPALWPQVMPSLGRSVSLDLLVEKFHEAKNKGEAELRRWASQHLNIEIGTGLHVARWTGAELWDRQTDKSLADLDAMLARCEIVVIGIDGGGRDDLLGLCVLGREAGTGKWLCWTHGWAFDSVLERRKSIATVIEAAQRDGELTLINEAEIADGALPHIDGLMKVVGKVNDLGILAAVSIDPAQLGPLIFELAKIDVTPENGLLAPIKQGWALMEAIKGADLMLMNRTLWHSGSKLMNWCVGNLKIEPMATAIRATKVSAGDAKIDLAMAFFDAAAVMMKNPEAAGAITQDYELPVWA